MMVIYYLMKAFVVLVMQLDKCTSTLLYFAGALFSLSLL